MFRALSARAACVILHDMEGNRFRTPIPEGRRMGCSVLGWIVFALLLVAIVFIGYRTKGYYDRLRSGEIVELPQFNSKFTAARAGGKTSAVAADRSAVEAGDNPTLGLDKDAKLTIVEFADFGCPYSKEESSVVRSLMAKYGDRVKFIYRDFPIESLHPDAPQASAAAECAREQGKFWAYHDKLYANSPAIGFKDLSRYAQEVGLDEAQFDRCLASGRYDSVVASDTIVASGLGVSGTPTFFLNGNLIEGAIPQDTFDKLISKLLQ
jgi:protein-disulfide isomerase